jgi:hypothetical protein
VTIGYQAKNARFPAHPQMRPEIRRVNAKPQQQQGVQNADSAQKSPICSRQNHGSADNMVTIAPKTHTAFTR